CFIPPASRYIYSLSLHDALPIYVLGGLKPATRRWLDQVAANLASGKPARPPARKVMPGTRLLREWQGVPYEVLIAEQGVLFRGEIGRAHVWTPVTDQSRMPSSAS